MRYLFILILCIVMSGMISCDDDTVCVCPDPVYTITGRVLYAESMSIVDNSRIYISFGDDLNFSDTTGTDSQGAFRFEGAYQGEFQLFAGIPDTPLTFSYITPIPEIMDNTGLAVFCAGDMLLYEVFENSPVTGHVDYEGTPAAGADVALVSISPGEYFPPDETVTDAEGNYSFSRVVTGNYIVVSYLEGLIGETGVLFCDGITACEADTVYLEVEISVDKPAIYIYPDSDRIFQVRLGLVNGTDLTESIPEYDSGWNVFVETAGRIEHKYDYLFYEASIKYAPEFNAGWSIRRENLSDELQGILSDIGLNEKETEDFLEYWLGRLTEYKYYTLYPVFDRSLDQYVELLVTPEPDARLRFWLFFVGTEDSEDRTDPAVTGFQRGTTTVVEWGGVLLN